MEEKMSATRMIRRTVKRSSPLPFFLRANSVAREIAYRVCRPEMTQLPRLGLGNNRRIVLHGRWNEIVESLLLFPKEKFLDE